MKKQNLQATKALCLELKQHHLYWIVLVKVGHRLAHGLRGAEIDPCDYGKNNKEWEATVNLIHFP